MTMSETAAPSTRRPFPGFLQGVALVSLAFFLQLLLGIGLAIILAVVDVAQGREPAVQAPHPAHVAGINLVALSVVIVLGVWLSRARTREVLPMGSPPWRFLLGLVPMLLGCSIVLSELDNLLRMILAPPAWFQAMMQEILGGEQSPWWSLLLVVVVAPITEEPLFRGVLLRGFLLRYSTRRALLLSALVFAAFHANPWQFLPGFVYGLLLGWLFWRTRSLVPCLLGHAIVNGIPRLVAALGLGIPGYSAGVNQAAVLQPLWFDLAGIALVGIGGWLLLLETTRNSEGRLLE